MKKQNRNQKPNKHSGNYDQMGDRGQQTYQQSYRGDGMDEESQSYSQRAGQYENSRSSQSPDWSGNQFTQQAGSGRSENRYGNESEYHTEYQGGGRQNSDQASWQRQSNEAPFGRQQESQFGSQRYNSPRHESQPYYQSQGQQGRQFEGSHYGRFGTADSHGESYEQSHPSYGTGAGRQGPFSYGQGNFNQSGSGMDRSSMDRMQQGQGKSSGYRGKGPKGYKLSDEKIQDHVSQELYESDDIDATTISVKVENGEVILEGSVDSRATKRAIEDLVENLSGVQEAINNLRVAKNTEQDKSEKDKTEKESKSGAASSFQTIRNSDHDSAQKKRSGER